MNTVITNLFRATARCSPQHNKVIVAFLSVKPSPSPPDQNVVRKRKTISKAMQAYVDRLKRFEEDFVTASKDYNTGKRFLATLMAEDPETFTKEDVDKAIQYLLPSGLHQPLARPEMSPPKEITETAKFDDTGRPFHYLFYTAFPKYYELMHETAIRFEKAERLLEELHSKGLTPESENQADLVGSEWVDNKTLKKELQERLTEDNYAKVIRALQRLADHPMSAHFKDFIMKYRKMLVQDLSSMEVPQVLLDGDRSMVTTQGTRKSARATVIVRSKGTGQIVINEEHDILYFPEIQSRQQILFPLQLSGLLNKVDVEATVTGGNGGSSAQSGAIRYALSLACSALVDDDTRAKMQMAGLFTRDWRRKERKKPGKRRARRGYTWLKR